MYMLYSVYIYAVQRGHWGELRTMPVEGAGLLAVMHAGLRCVYVYLCSIYVYYVCIYAVLRGHWGELCIYRVYSVYTNICRTVRTLDIGLTRCIHICRAAWTLE